MESLKVVLQNCYGIASLQNDFDFSVGNLQKPKSKAYAIYAPNGSMKSSFAKTFFDLSQGKQPKEERYNRPSSSTITKDGDPLPNESIFVLKAELDISADSPAMTNILINPIRKERYDSLLVELEKLKTKVINSLQKQSKVKKANIESSMMEDFGENSFPACIVAADSNPQTQGLDVYQYATIFDSKTLEVLKSQEFLEKANEFSERYQEIFQQSGTIYQRGVFNPTKAEISFGTLDKQGFFAGGHKVHFRGEPKSVSKEELDYKLREINASLDSDDTLKNIRKSLAKNAQTQAFTDLLESLDSTQVDYLLENLKPENQANFRKQLWCTYVQNSSEASAYIQSYEECREELVEIEAEAALDAPRWTEAVTLFNDRFVDMPFVLEVANQAQAALGKENAKLKFIFKDGEDRVEWSRSEVKTLSQGEKRALYLLNFIFEVEARKIAGQETVFIIDDVADSFDYKNKHAIIQYLKDLCAVEHFYQIILTHNFDFFRSLVNTFVQYDRCLMVNKAEAVISLQKTEGIKNYFTGKLKKKVCDCDCILCATIPFARNLIEYTRGTDDDDYLKLTSLLHWKKDTASISVGHYLSIYNRLFLTKYETKNDEPVVTVLFKKANEISSLDHYEGLNLEDKVLLSIAIRLKAEQFLLNELRRLKGEDDYWCDRHNQFGTLIDEYERLGGARQTMRILEKVSITVSSNIHLNSFMYEPILDLNVDHLVVLYQEVCNIH